VWPLKGNEKCHWGLGKGLITPDLQNFSQGLRCRQIIWNNLGNRKDHLEDLGVDGKDILEWILGK